jgi:hypothetical protein
MPRISDWYFKAAILFLVVGIALGIQMSIARDHSAMGAHAHINLLGWVTSALFGGYFALNPAKAEGMLPRVQFGVYIVGVVVMVAALYLLLTGNTGVEMVVATGSLITFAGVLLFGYIVFSPARAGGGMKAMPAE